MLFADIINICATILTIIASFVGAVASRGVGRISSLAFVALHCAIAIHVYKASRRLLNATRNVACADFGLDEGPASNSVRFKSSGDRK